MDTAAHTKRSVVPALYPVNSLPHFRSVGIGSIISLNRFSHSTSHSRTAEALLSIVGQLRFVYLICSTSSCATIRSKACLIQGRHHWSRSHVLFSWMSSAENDEVGGPLSYRRGLSWQPLLEFASLGQSQPSKQLGFEHEASNVYSCLCSRGALTTFVDAHNIARHVPIVLLG